MLLTRFTRNKQLLNLARRQYSAVAAEAPVSMNLEEHIRKYKTKQFADTYMDLSSLPELGNPLHNAGGEDGVTMSPTRFSHILHSIVGPEQVSPHYENFGMSRKIALTFWGVTLGIYFVKASGDIHYALYSAYQPFMVFAGTFYVFMEAKKVTLLPLLNRFYWHAEHNETLHLLSSFQENMHSVFRERESIAREQLEYFDLHKEFKSIKNNAIERFLRAEESLLKETINNRTKTILNGMHQMETSNQKNVTSKVLENIRAEVAKLRANPDQSIIDKSFDSALVGIQNGRMEYKNDGVLERVLQKTKAEIAKINNLTEEEKKNMICLTEIQMKTLKDADEKSQKDFLNKKPAGLEAALRDNESFEQMMSQW